MHLYSLGQNPTFGNSFKTFMSLDFYKKDTKSALEAKEYAQWIAFGPSVFQAARILRSSGILSEIEKTGKAGLTLDEVVAKVDMPLYGVRVLLEAGLGIGLVLLNEGKFSLTKTAFFLLHDRMTQANMDFSHEVNYLGMFDLDKSIQNGRPEGLKTLGNWPTVYEGLAHLPKDIQDAWFAFDHFYSDTAFPEVLPLVFKYKPKHMADIGGNTGKWTIAATGYDPDVNITIIDLPGQLNMSKANITKLGLANRVNFHEMNILDESQIIPKGFDAIWMSQFLDCFSEAEIISILKRCYEALNENGQVYILEPFWDRQRFASSAFCLQQTSLYFTAIANGNSQMYFSETFLKCIEKANFIPVEQTDGIGVSHTLLVCKKKG